jgi:hypothetical protein
MAELGIDVSGQTSKTLERCLGQPFDAVVTVCDDANEACPVFPRARERLHWSLPDPSRAVGSEAARLAAYRVVRDALRARIEREAPGRFHGTPPLGDQRGKGGIVVHDAQHVAQPHGALPFGEGRAGDPRRLLWHRTDRLGMQRHRPLLWNLSGSRSCLHPPRAQPPSATGFANGILTGR